MKFVVQHFVFCDRIDYRDRTRPHQNSILDGVDYAFAIPAGTEFPFEPEEFWLFARFLRTSDDEGETRPLWVVCYWLDSPTGDEEVEVWARNIGPVMLRRPVGDRPWVFRNSAGEKTYRFPGPGRYVFKLMHEIDKYPNWRVRAREYIRVEVRS
ncbi:MAG: hypothetical protein K2V38_25100 [Gemmataceae bacterium]|nr:hypothetical protein [Gemmataceae bacterium]